VTHIDPLDRNICSKTQIFRNPRRQFANIFENITFEISTAI